MICENCEHSKFGVEQSTGNYFCVNCGLVTDDTDEQMSFGKSINIAQKGISTLISLSDPKLKSPSP